MVGGRGTRLGALTDTTPKPLLPVNNRPFIDYCINHAILCGFDDIILLAGYLGEQFLPYHLLRRNGAMIRVLREPTPMGTAGAFGLFGHKLNDHFLVVNGDTYLGGNWLALDQQLRQTPNAGLVMALSHQADTARYGLVHGKNGQITQFSEKTGKKQAGFINAGVYAVRKNALLPLITSNPCGFETHILPQLLQQRAIYYQKTRAFFIDMGIPETYQYIQHNHQFISH